MDSADDLTFKIIFSGDGAGRLRDRVKEKLKEFMGDYTDDTLVEYVIVLLKNGRRKEEAKNELNVFLGDDSDSFVSWLWDHLRSNLDLYAQSKESHTDEVVKEKPHIRSESEMIDSDRVSTNRRSKEWKGIVRDPDEPPPLRSAIIANIKSEDDKNQKNRSPPPQSVIHRKRGRSGERGHTELKSQVEREAVPKPRLSASRRLLQFAVRDAVDTSRSPGLTSEPSFKRLRSVVSTPADDSPLEERHPLLARVPKTMPVAIKAVAAAAEDAVKVKPSGNVFDRLGRSTNPADQFTEDDEGFTRITEATDFTHNEDYKYNNINASYVVDGTSYKPSSNKIVNKYSSVNKTRVVSDTSVPKLVEEAKHTGNNSNGNGISIIQAQREVQKTLLSTGVSTINQPTEDADSRTIFVSNVHFAATKEGISRHFNKFGDVLKVIIVTEAATGQPKGSAYVEFMRKEAAENALSLDGTSFMSRILKVHLSLSLSIYIYISVCVCV
ncbi:uncharacterized protein LOC143574312 [Bidens hawaiensis]|uniref:uncharacterized protein LOC143574312 n=1 Tax=Bidens hawaiensis TaxID=980011 RepID=UPI0040495D34